MTTQNIPQLAQLRGQARRTAQAVRDRARQVQQELAALDGAQVDVQVLAATLIQNIDDDRVVLTEEGEQLASILGNGQPAATPPVIPTPPTTTTPAVVLPIVQQTPVVPTVVQPDVIAPATTPAANPANPRLSRMRWGFNGAFLALLISLMTRGWFAGLADVHGTVDWLFRAGWIVAVTAAGFFGGGWLGSYVDARRNNTPPVQPAPTP